MKKIKAIVIGANYGLNYISIISRSNSPFRLEGLVSKGSQCSKNIARQFNVPLYTCIEKIPDKVDAAIVAVPAKEYDNVVPILLNQGIHVFCEHPLSLRQISKFSNLAKNKSTFYINTHFPNLGPAKNFTKLCKEKIEKNKPEHIFVTCSQRSLFSTLDLLYQAIGHENKLKLGCVNEENSLQNIPKNGNYRIFLGKMGKVPITLNISLFDQESPDNGEDSPVLQNIKLIYPAGILEMHTPFGPTTWVNAMKLVNVKTNYFETISEKEDISFNCLKRERIRANAMALFEFHSLIQKRSDVDYDRYILVSESYEMILKYLYLAS